MMQELKKSTSKWIKTQDRCSADFQWQEGYGAFTIGASQIPVLRSYLARQKLHHQKSGFEDELLSLAERYGVDYDPKCLWGEDSTLAGSDRGPQLSGGVATGY